MKRSYSRTIAAIVVAISLAVAAFGYWRISWRAFDRTRWTTARYQNERASMYNDLVDRHLYNGMGRTEIERKLGKPDHEEEDLLVYFSGHSPSLAIQLDNKRKYRGHEFIGSE